MIGGSGINGGKGIGKDGGVGDGVKPGIGGNGINGTGGSWNGLGISGGGWNGLGRSGGGWNGLGISGGGWNGFGGKIEGGCNGFGGRIGGAGKKNWGWTTFSSDNWDFFEDVSVGFDSVLVFPWTGGNLGSQGRGGRGGRVGNGGSWGSGERGGRYWNGGRPGIVGSWIGGGSGRPFNGGREALLESSPLLEFSMLGFWLHRFGCFRGLKVKNPAENMCNPCFLDLRWSEDEVAVDATAQYGSLLLINFTEHPSIFFTCLLTENGNWTLNSPLLSVFTSFRKLISFELSSLHSTATDAPENIHNPKNICFQPLNLISNPKLIPI